MGDLFEMFGELAVEAALAAAGEIISKCEYRPANYLSSGPEFYRIVPSQSNISESKGESR
jgi:hypothetical protein